MGRKPKFKREEILSCAYEILNEKSLKEVTARNVATRLGCSTIAIYSTFESMDEVKNELSKMAKKKLFEYTQVEYTNLEILNIGIGVCLFAKEEGDLFRTIFLREGLSQEFLLEVMSDFKKLISDGFKRNKKYAHFDEEITEWTIKKGWYYTFGYATMICTGFYTNLEFTAIEETLLEMGQIIMDEAQKKMEGKNEFQK